MSIKQRQSKAQTRRTILERGYEMYRDGRLDRHDVKVAAVLKELGYTTGAAYYIWPNQAAFRRDLMVHIAEHVEYGSIQALADRIEGVRASYRSFEDAILRGGDAYFEYFLTQEDFFIGLRFYEDPEQPIEIQRAMSLGYERIQAEVHKFFEEALAFWGRKMTSDDYGINELVVSCTAMIEGFSLRHRFQRDKVRAKVPCEGGEHYLFSVNLLHLAKANTCPVSGRA